MKIIPAIDLMEGQVVRLVKGKPENKTVYSNDPQGMAKKWEKSGADMLHMVDLDATLQRGSNLDLIEKTAKQISIPIQVAGGLRNESLIERVLDFANRAVVGTLAFKDVDLVEKLASKFGKKIVLAVDHNDGIVVVNGWQKSTDLNIDQTLENFYKKNFTEFLVTNVSRDGTLEGPDIQTLSRICKNDNLKVIASGGISSSSDIVKVKQSNAWGVILGKALYDGKISIEEAKTLA